MPQFTQLNLNAKSGNSAPTNKGGRSTSKPKILMFAGLLTLAMVSGAALLAVNGCSKKEAVKTEPLSSNQLTMPPATTPNSPTIATTPPADNQTTKKPVKKIRKSSTISYVNRTYGLSLQYPRNYSLKTGDEAQLQWSDSEPVPMNFIQPGGVNVAAIELPRSMYPGTDLASAFFMVSVNRNLNAAQCDQFAFPKANNSQVTPVSELSPAKVKLGWMEFNEIEQSGGNAMKQSETKYYHVLENNACYEFSLGLGTALDETEKETKPVDRQEVFGKLEKILATVKIKSTSASPTPEVEATEQKPPVERSEPLVGITTPKPIPPQDGNQQ
jgi:hypothetical protein